MRPALRASNRTNPNRQAQAMTEAHPLAVTTRACSCARNAPTTNDERRKPMSDNTKCAICAGETERFDAELCDGCAEITQAPNTQEPTPSDVARVADQIRALARQNALETPNPDVDETAQAFFERPGDFYLVNITIALDNQPMGMKYGFQFPLKADADQLPYATEIVQQLTGALGPHSHVTMTKAKILDPLPGTLKGAYAVRPPEPAPQYQGKHRTPDEATRDAINSPDLDRAIDAIEDADRADELANARRQRDDHNISLCGACGKPEPNDWCWDGRSTRDCPFRKTPRYAKDFHDEIDDIQDTLRKMQG